MPWSPVPLYPSDAALLVVDFRLASLGPHTAHVSESRTKRAQFTGLARILTIAAQFFNPDSPNFRANDWHMLVYRGPAARLQARSGRGTCVIAKRYTYTEQSDEIVARLRWPIGASDVCGIGHPTLCVTRGHLACLTDT